MSNVGGSWIEHSPVIGHIFDVARCYSLMKCDLRNVMAIKQPDCWNYATRRVIETIPAGHIQACAGTKSAGYHRTNESFCAQCASSSVPTNEVELKVDQFDRDGKRLVGRGWRWDELTVGKGEVVSVFSKFTRTLTQVVKHDTPRATCWLDLFFQLPNTMVSSY